MVDPYPTCARLRAMGPVLHDPVHDAFVLPRYDDVRAVPQDWETFGSAQGVGLNERANKMAGRGILTTDPPLHDTRRKVLNTQLVPREVARHLEFIVATANEIVDELVARGSFDAVDDLAARYSVEIVADLCGLPEEGWEHLIEADVAHEQRPPRPRAPRRDGLLISTPSRHGDVGIPLPGRARPTTASGHRERQRSSSPDPKCRTRAVCGRCSPSDLRALALCGGEHDDGRPDRFHKLRTRTLRKRTRRRTS